MSKMSELDQCVGELRGAAQSLNAVADSLTALFSMNDNTASKPEMQTESVKSEPVITLEQVRAVLADKSRAGHTAAVRELLQKHGAEKLSAIDPANYAALLADAEVLGNG
ncbi:MAG: hypothetical protein LBU62_03490 [Bacteroidales bacterium]|jgi:hypothetical protein|nr:hypothetical protein [Bacteroidales bacterium]